MKKEVDKVTIRRFTENGVTRLEDTVASEFSLTIILNGKEVVTLFCSPAELDYLAVGFLLAEGRLKDKDEISQMEIDETAGVARIATRNSNSPPAEHANRRFIASGGGRGASLYDNINIQEPAPIKSQIHISPEQVFGLMERFIQHSEIFKATGGVHSAALCDAGSLLAFSEDIGRHNAIDKIFGRCWLEDIATDNRIVITSGRISSEILLKVARRNVPILISKSAPTNLGINLARELGITLLGFVREKRINAYTNDWRLVP